METKKQISTSVKTLIDNCVSKIRQVYKDEEITDFYVFIDLASNELRIVDDNELLLSSHPILPDGVVTEEEESDDMGDLKSDVIAVMRQELQTASKSHAFDGVNVFHPFSFVLEDDDTMEDLLIVDDANVIIGDELLKGLDDDLDSFLEELMNE